MPNGTTDSFLDHLRVFVRRVVLVLRRPAQSRNLHLRDVFFVAAGRDGAPRGTRVVKIPMLEREREASAERRRLTEDRQTFLAASLEPCEAALMNLGIVARGRDRVVQNRAIRLGREPFEECEIILDMSGRLR